MTGSHGAGARTEGHGRRARAGADAGSVGGGRKQRRGGRRKRLVLSGLVALVVLLTAGAGAVYLKLNGNINTFDGKGLSPDRPEAAAADANGDTPQNVLVIGSDSRSGDNSKLGAGTGDIGRSDTAILLHIYADHQHAVGISIPRDSLVDIPPCLLPDGKWTQAQHHVMFNSAFSVGETPDGNPACSQNTVEKLTGLRVDHTIVMNFEGFAAMTEAVHGVEVCMPKDVYQRDLNPNLHERGTLLYRKGVQNVSGKAALDYVRLRHGLGDGSDIGRTKRQQAFISSLIKKVKGQGLNPTVLLPLANAATKSLTVDPGLGSAAKLLSFAMSAKSIDLKNLKFITAPWRYAGARVDLVHPDVDNLWAALRADRTLDGQDASGKKAEGATPAPATAPAVSGAGISVAVYNGTTVTGLAGRAADTLRGDGFTVTGTASARSRDHTTTVIEYGSGRHDQAQTLAKLFPGATVKQISGAALNVVLGHDYAAGSTPSDKASAAPAPLPSRVTEQARSADDDLCSNVSYG